MDFDDQVDWDEIDYWTDRCPACDEKCGATCADYQTGTVTPDTPPSGGDHT